MSRLAASFFWRCIAGVMGASSMLISIGGIGILAVIESWGEEATIQAGAHLVAA
jgi:hypothetical protein